MLGQHRGPAPRSPPALHFTVSVDRSDPSPTPDGPPAAAGRLLPVRAALGRSPLARVWRRIPGPWRPLAVLAPLAAALVIKGLLNGSETAPRRRPPLVATAAVTRGNLPVRYPVNAEVKPLVSVEVRPEVDGTIQRLDFQDGSMVRRGQVLAQINPTPYQAAFDLALANTSNKAKLPRFNCPSMRHSNVQALNQTTAAGQRASNLGVAKRRVMGMHQD